MPEPDRKKVLLAHGGTLLRAALCRLLQACSEVEVVGAVASGRVAVVEAFRTRPEVVVMDVAISDLNGLDATRRIVAGRFGTKVIGIAGQSEQMSVVRMLMAGASGCLLEGCCTPEDLLIACRTVCLGGYYLCSNLEDDTLDSCMAFLAGDGGREDPRLSPRQRQVLRLYAEGKGTRAIASQLGVSVKTVETHRKIVSEKLGLNGMAEFTRYVLREGITSP